MVWFVKPTTGHNRAELHHCVQRNSMHLLWKVWNALVKVGESVLPMQMDCEPGSDNLLFKFLFFFLHFFLFHN